jgi:pantoate--beta-alanine ligase
MNNLIKTADTIEKLHTYIEDWRHNDYKIALVPTMGALHEGHLSLVELARQCADKVIVSVFVNPKQFGEGEDLEQYPRDLSGDLEKLADSGVDLVYAPGADQIYPPGFSTKISVRGVSDGLCSNTRPHFFDGVATVVTKLLLQCTPDIAIFGEKDYQQLLVIRRLTIDLGLPVEIVGAPLIREADGLALSSRNAYLSPSERETAPLLYRVLNETATRLIEGLPMKDALVEAQDILTTSGFRLDYFELRDALTLEPLERFEEKPARLLIAAVLGRTRLIDNIAVIG